MTYADHSEAADSPSPTALLRGVEQARMKYSSLKATLEVRYLSPPPAVTIRGLVEMDGNRRRFEVFQGDVPGQVIMRDGGEFFGFRRVPNEDLHIYDLKRAIGVRGDVAFDPRVLGLSDLMTADDTIRDCLWYEGSKTLEVVGREEIQGVPSWHVKAVRGDYTTEYWIEEPSFRVHRLKAEGPDLRTAISSEYESGKTSFPFPKRVTTRRESGGVTYEKVYIVQDFELGSVIASTRFTLKAMDLPVNTPAVDYRIKRIVGYWDGEALSEHPVYSGERPVVRSTPGSGSRWRITFIALNLLVILGALALWRMKRGRGSDVAG